MSLEKLDDKEIFDQLHKAGLAEKLVNEEHWKLLKEASDRIVERAVKEFALKADPTNLAHIIQLQTVIRQYKYGFLREIEILKTESELLFDEARDRGLLGGEGPNIT